MFARNRTKDRDIFPLWALLLILPGLVIVSTLLIRRMRSQARLMGGRSTPVHEFRLESSERGIPLQPVEPGEAVETNRADSHSAETSAAAAEMRSSLIPEENQVAQAAQRDDDLKVIEGVGPKIELILKNAGIHTYQALANTSVEQLYQVLHRANLRLADPNTWPEQARLAANANWDFLKALQARTRANRRSIED